MTGIFYLASCPRCGGDLYREVLDGQVEYHCLQCSFIIYAELFARQLVYRQAILM